VTVSDRVQFTRLTHVLSGSRRGWLVLFDVADFQDLTRQSGLFLTQLNLINSIKVSKALKLVLESRRGREGREWTESVSVNLTTRSEQG